MATWNRYIGSIALGRALAVLMSITHPLTSIRVYVTRHSHSGNYSFNAQFYGERFNSWGGLLHVFGNECLTDLAKLSGVVVVMKF